MALNPATRSVLLLLAVLVSGSAAASTSPPDVRVRYELSLQAGQPEAEARVVVSQRRGALVMLSFDGDRVSAPEGPGTVRVRGDRYVWEVPPSGGTFRYRVTLDLPRATGRQPGNNAWVGDNWAVFRGDHAFPIRSSDRLPGTTLAGELRVTTPKDWSLVTPYRRTTAGRLPVRNPGNRLARPIGWIAAGDLLTRRETIDGIAFAVTGPRGHRVQRIPVLGVLRWTLPRLLVDLGGVGPGGVQYVPIVLAPDPMWLGALAAPNSIFVHSLRPIISEDATSPIVHEMVHVLLADLRTPEDQDWIVEGLAEYLSLRALRDSGTISRTRFDRSIENFRRRGAPVADLRTAYARGAVTARAVAIFHDLDAELAAATRGREDLGSLVRNLRRAGRGAGLDELREAAAQLAGRPVAALSADAVPGFD